MPNKSSTSTPPTDNGSPSPWAELGLGPALVAALRRVGFAQPTDIQKHLIPPALAGHDCLGQAKTGTGKTAAFALPILQMSKTGVPAEALILVPTRELAAQVDSHFHELNEKQPLRTALLYGGHRIHQQIQRLKTSPEIIIGTPGRVLDLLRRKVLDVSKTRFVVLDEVDRMLDIGFRDDIRRILREVKGPHQTIFVSATIDDEIRKLATSYMHAPQEINVSCDQLTVESIEHGYVSVDPHDKFDLLMGFLEYEQPTLAIVFTNTKQGARRLAERLKKRGVNCKEIHGDLMQSRRDRVMKSFRAAQIQVLVATDVASRGLDVMEISHIVNYDLPEDPSAYVHRIGRTARMGNRGQAVSFVRPDEGKTLTEIEKLINEELPRVEAPWVFQRTAPTVEPPPDIAAATVPQRGQRYNEALHRSDLLESHGLQPVRRTLGSRFRTSRRRR